MPNNDTSGVSTNLLGRHVTWVRDGRMEGGTVVAVAWAGEFVLLVATTEGLRQKTASGVTVEN